MTTSLTLAENLLLKYRFLIREDLPEKTPFLLGIAQFTPTPFARYLGNQTFSFQKNVKINLGRWSTPKFGECPIEKGVFSGRSSLRCVSSINFSV